MSRRRRTVRTKTQRVAWKVGPEGHIGLFRLAGVGLTPPADLKVQYRGLIVAFEAVFRMEGGQPVTLRTRLRYEAAGDMTVLDETMRVSFGGRRR